MSKSHYKIFNSKDLFWIFVFVAVAYAVAYSVFGALLANLIPEPIVKSLKFTAFLLGSYSLWNEIGKGQHKEAMQAQEASATTETDKETAKEQLRLLARDDKRSIALGALAFLILTVLAFFGEV